MSHELPTPRTSERYPSELDWAAVRAERDLLREKLAKRELEIARLENRLAAHEPLTDRPASAVTPRGDDRERWLSTRLSAAGMKTRDAGRWLMARFDSERFGADERAHAVEMMHEMVDETNRWKDAWSATTVEMDHKVRDASKRALDCVDHGRVISQLEEQVAYFDRSRSNSEAGRLALLNGLDTVDRTVDAIDLYVAMGREPELTIEKITADLRKISTACHRAHARAWKR